MSVALMIDNPINEKEEHLYVPIAAEHTFEKYWQTAAKQLELEWVPFFQSGIVIGWERESVIIEELEKIKNWFLINVSDQARLTSLLERVVNVIHAVKKVFKDKEIRIFIG